MNEAYRRAIKGIESSGNYQAIGPRHRKYGEPLGAYQVMESNLPQWSKDAFGRQVSRQEFLSNPELQDKLFDHRFGILAQKHGSPQDAASAWHSGRSLKDAAAAGAKDSLGTKTVDYANKFSQAAGLDPVMQQALAQAPGGTAPGGFNVPPGPQDPMQMALAGDESNMPAAGSMDVQMQPKEPAGFMEGGPGALFGKPQEGWNMGDALTGAGIAAMSRDNPQGAAAMAAALRYSKEKSTSTKAQKQVVSQDQKRGLMNVYDPNTNTVNSIQYAQPAAPEANPKLRSQYDEHYTAYDTANAVRSKFDSHREAIADGKVDLDYLSKLDTNYRNIVSSQLTEPQRNALRLMADIEDLRNAKLLEHKGVQTEGDATRVMNSIMPGSTTLANKHAVLDLLDRGSTDLARAAERRYTLMDPLVRKYGDDLVGDTATWRGRHDTYKKERDEFEGRYAPKRDAFYKQGVPQQGEAAPPAAARTQPGAATSAPRPMSIEEYKAWKQRRTQ